MQHHIPHPRYNIPTNYQPNQLQNATPRGGFHRGFHQFQNIRLPRSGVGPGPYQHTFNSTSSFNFDGNEEHWCETCDRGFRTADLLGKHKEQHQKCNIDGCQFIAHPKVITKHIQMQHSTGIYKKIGNLNNPEEIKRWIEERKRRYPTKENIDKKAAEVQEKRARGEKMGLHEKRFNGNKNFTRNNQDRRPGAGDKRTKSDFKNTRPNKIRKKLSTNKEKIPQLSKEKIIKLAMENEMKLKPFAGIQDLVSEDDVEEETEDQTSYCLIDDEETTPHIVEDINSSKLEICGALSSLLCDYGSSDDDKSNKQLPNVASESNDTSKSMLESSYLLSKIDVGHAVEKENKYCILNKTNVIVNEDSDSSPEETNVVKEEKSIELPEIKDKPVTPAAHSKRQRPGHSRRLISYPKSKVPSTLLQKLLFKEMRHERNMVLQCIRYIVKNNFFNK